MRLAYPLVAFVAEPVVATETEPGHVAGRRDWERDTAAVGFEVKMLFFDIVECRMKVLAVALDGDGAFLRTDAEGDSVGAAIEDRQGALGALDVVREFESVHACTVANEAESVVVAAAAEFGEVDLL